MIPNVQLMPNLLRVEIETCDSGWLVKCWRGIEASDGEAIGTELSYVRAGNPTMDEAWDRARTWLRDEMERR